MLLRRRRCLGTLSVLWLIGVLLVLAVGGAAVTAVAIALGIGVVGYLNFLRTQTSRDRERYEHRRSRARSGLTGNRPTVVRM